MRDTMPTWPQTILITACGTAFIVFGYILSRMREGWGPAAWVVLALLVVFGLGFMVSVMVFYMRPQHGGKAVPFLLAFVLGHAALVALLWRIGVFGR